MDNSFVSEFNGPLCLYLVLRMIQLFTFNGDSSIMEFFLFWCKVNINPKFGVYKGNSNRVLIFLGFLCRSIVIGHSQTCMEDSI